MSSTPEFTDNLRAHIMAQPDLILEDPDLMRALIAARLRPRADVSDADAARDLWARAPEP